MSVISLSAFEKKTESMNYVRKPYEWNKINNVYISSNTMRFFIPHETEYRFVAIHLSVSLDGLLFFCSEYVC